MHEKKKKNDLTDIISYLDSSGTMPKVNVDSNYDLAFKLMNENNLKQILVEDKNKKIIGVIDEKNLFSGVVANSFEAKITKNINTNVKKVRHNLTIKKLLLIFKKESLVFVIKNRKFIGIITKNDLLCYLKRNLNA